MSVAERLAAAGPSCRQVPKSSDLQYFRGTGRSSPGSGIVHTLAATSGSDEPRNPDRFPRAPAAVRTDGREQFARNVCLHLRATPAAAASAPRQPAVRPQRTLLL